MANPREPGGGSSARWVALVLRVPESIQEELAGILGEGSLGVEIAPKDADTTTLRIYLPVDADASAKVAAAKETLSGFGLSSELWDLRLEPVEDERWVERYQATLLPIPLGEGFLVIPGQPPESNGGRTPIVLPPGRAFGTGEHETTQLCASGLEEHVEPGSVWADVGTGTGILAVVAIGCGAVRVVACDVDPEAIEVAREVLESNGLIDAIELELGSAEELGPESVDGIVANIDPRYFLEHARELGAALRDGGLLFASGFLVEQVPEVRRALEEADLDVVEEYERGPWAMVAAERAAR